MRCQLFRPGRIHSPSQQNNLESYPAADSKKLSLLMKNCCLLPAASFIFPMLHAFFATDHGQRTTDFFVAQFPCIHWTPGLFYLEVNPGFSFLGLENRASHFLSRG